MYNIKAACHRSSDTAESPSDLHKASSYLFLLQMQLVFGKKQGSCLWQYIHVEAKFPSQDVVHGPGSGALRRAGLRVGAAGGEGGHVSQRCRSAAGLHGG